MCMEILCFSGYVHCKKEDYKDFYSSLYDDIIEGEHAQIWGIDNTSYLGFSIYDCDRDRFFSQLEKIFNGKECYVKVKYSDTNKYIGTEDDMFCREYVNGQWLESVMKTHQCDDKTIYPKVEKNKDIAEEDTSIYNLPF